MIEEINRKILLNEMTSEDLIKRIMVMKITITQIKKGNRHPSLKYKATNISTPNIYEKAEI
jgi:DNA-binding XRE family transcriptional regulator